MRAIGVALAALFVCIALASAQDPVSPDTRELGRGWDAAYEKPDFNLQPSAFLVEVAATLQPGAALDVGMGQGRNALFLAQRGWRVSGFDVSEVAIAQARDAARRAGATLDARIQSADEFAWGQNRWDLIVAAYFPALRANLPRIVASLKPGGHLLVEAFHADIVKDRPTGAGRGVTFDAGELVTLASPLRIVRYEEPRARADWGLFETRLVRLLAQKQP